jgi:hypothetical protein
MEARPIETDGGGTGASTTFGGTTVTQTATAAAGGGGFGMGTLEIPVLVASAGVPVRAPAIQIRPGQRVEAWPIIAGAGKAYSALGYSQVLGNPRAIYVSTTPARRYSVSALSEIWVNADNAGDGILLVVTKG